MPRAPSHAVAVVQDQVDGREEAEMEEQKFVDVTEPLAGLAVKALSRSGKAVEAETLCSSLLIFSLAWTGTR